MRKQAEARQLEFEKDIMRAITCGFSKTHGKFATVLHIKDMENKEKQQQMLEALKQIRPAWYEYYMFLESNEPN